MKVRTFFVSNSSTSSFILIGVPLDYEKYESVFYTQTQVRNCDCEMPEGIDITKLKCCPECGGKAMRIECEPKKGISEGDGGKIGVFEIHEHAFGDDDACVVLPGTYQTGSEYNVNMVEIPDNIAELKNQMREALEPLGLWDESKFGIWSGARYS